jgi:beta-lactamase regulating signal transducer with metallopeptidase domain
MSAIPELGTLLESSLAQAVGWALLQFIWQGALVGVVSAIALAALRRSGADVRYVVATISMSLLLTLPVVGVIQELNGAGRPAQPQAASTLVNPAGSRGNGVFASGGSSLDRDRTSAAPAGAGRVFSATNPGIPAVESGRLASWLLVVWMAGVLVLTARLVGGWVWVQRLRIHGKPADDSVCEVVERLARTLHVTRVVRLVESAAVEVPTVMGWLKPVVLLPASALAGLSPAQLEAVLAHELAHVRRHDYLVNLLQVIVETLLFYHPAVWWISHQIRIERENCCDDLAVNLCGDRVLYAQALADLEQLRGSADRLVLAANGGSLGHRVRRLLGAPSHAGATPGWLAVAVSIAVIMSIAGIGARTRADETPKSEKQKASGDRHHVSNGSVPAIGAPEDIHRVLHDATRELSRALRDTHRALNATIRELFPQVPPLPPLPPMPPEPPLPPAQLLPQEPAEAFEPPTPMEPPQAPLPPEPPTLVDLPEAPAVPPPPAPAALAAPPTPASAAVRSQKNGNFMWSNDGEKLEVNYRGDIEFTDDDSDVKSLAPDGWLRIKESGRNGAHAIEFRSDASGKIERRFWVGTSERPFEPEGRKWLEQILPRFIRQTGIGAEARVRRIYRTKGAQGVLGEIGLIEGSWAKRIYFAELLKTPGLDARTVQQALEQAGREVDSDFELASLLISTSHLLGDDSTRKAYIEAARSIDSDFEMRRVYSSALKSGPLAPAVLAALLESSIAIGSDFEQASLLIDVAKVQPLTDPVRAPFFKAVGTIESDFEQRRVLSSVLTRGDVAPAVLASVLDSVAAVGSDFELATLLLEFVKGRSVEGALREPFFRAVDSIGSDFERGRVLQAVAKRSDAR